MRYSLKTYFLFLTFIFSVSMHSQASTQSQKVVSAQKMEEISEFGKYKGYTERRFNGYSRESKYVPTRDGTRLAMDIYHPTKNGVKADDKLPTLLWATHYRRATELPDGSVKSLFGIEGRSDYGLSQARYYLEHGYTIVAVDMRGCGASFGQRPLGNSGNDLFLGFAQDTYDMIEWAAAQSWSTGSVGMFGGSFMGHTQLIAASTKPPSLKAILPNVHAYFGWRISGDMVGLSALKYDEGMNKLDGLKGSEKLAGWSRKEVELLSMFNMPVAPVDGPRGHQLRAEAIADHNKNPKKLTEMSQEIRSNITRLYDPITVPLHESKIPIYSVGGLYDWNVESPLLIFGNHPGPKKVMMGPWTHAPSKTENNWADAYRPDETKTNWGPANSHLLNVEGLRWFDYWLRGVENGIMDDPLMHYAVIDKNDDNQGAWLATNQWPVANVHNKTFYLDSSPDGDLSLKDKAPAQSSEVMLQVDYTATTGPYTRYPDGNGQGPMAYPEMSELNAKALVYTSAPLDRDIAIVGSPIVELKIRSTAPDGPVMVYLEKVRADGSSEYIADAPIRASIRTVNKASPINSFGRPHLDWMRTASSFIPAFNAETVTLNWALKPAGNIFEKGSRIRIAITGADADNWVQDEVLPAPKLRVFMGPELSKITLPIMDDVSDLSIKSWVGHYEK